MGRSLYLVEIQTEGEWFGVIRTYKPKTSSYVSTFAQNNPTYEYWPKQSSGAIAMSFLNETVPLNLFPLTWLMPSGECLHV